MKHSFTTVHNTASYNLLHKSLVRENLHFTSLHFTACLLANSSTDVNTTVMWWCKLPNKTCSLGSLDKNVGLHSVIIPKRFLKIWLSFLTHTHCVSFPTQNCPYMTGNSDNVITDNFLFTFLSGNILDANNKKGNCQLFMSKSNRSRYPCKTATHISTITAYVTEREVQEKYKNINFNGNSHCTSHS
jgi:hypothetical protein